MSAPAHADRLTVTIMSARIFLAADAWVRFSVGPRPDAQVRYAVMNQEPTATDLLDETGWTEPGELTGYVPTGTDAERALEFCKGVSASEVSAGFLYRFCEIEAESMVATEIFGVLVSALTEELKKTPEIPGGRATSILCRAQGRYEGVLTSEPGARS